MARFEGLPIKDIINDYVNKLMFPRELAKLYGCGKTTINRILKKNNIKTRTISEAKKLQIKKYGCLDRLKLDIVKIIELYLNRNTSIKQIAKIFSCNVSVIKNRLRRNKVIIRTHKESVKLAIKFNPHSSWKLGLTNKTNEKLRKCSKKESKTKLRLFKEGKLKIWAKGLTKYNHPSLMSISIKQKEIKKGKYIGKENPMYGKKRPDLSKRNKEDIEFIKKRFKGLIKKPNKPETILINLFKQYNLPYKYVGDGELIIRQFNPDFINCNGQKKIIEMFGTYWHDLQENRGRDKVRLKTYSQYGFKTLIIWEHELKEIDKVLEKVKRFEYASS